MSETAKLKAQQLKDLSEDNQALYQKLAQSNVHIDISIQLASALKALVDQLFGGLDPLHPERASDQRLNYELAFEHRMKDVLDAAAAETTAQQAGLHIPPSSNGQLHLPT